MDFLPNIEEKKHFRKKPINRFFFICVIIVGVRNNHAIKKIKEKLTKK
jgi:hypothetical protein